MKRKGLPCQGPSCRALRPDWQFFCANCWDALPGWLRRQIAIEKDVCKQLRTAHTQELLRLRDLAVGELKVKLEKAKA